ncbi:TIR domain-containing protein [Anaerolineae bacterium CFX8]|nr:TIR domain-containing protein [Anaerolineae bacterium CFX8]
MRERVFMADVFNMSDVMISYSRKDKAFVQRLEAALRASGREVWVDWEDIPTGVDFMAEIFAGIEAANTFVFIISPDSVSSPVCLEEVRHAVTHKKRFVPILYREIDDQAKGSFHPALGAHNWFFFREDDDFNQAFNQLVKTLDTDIPHVRLHTRLLVRARDWESKGRTDSLLLRGDDLREAETWLMQNANKEPPPTELHREYILASRRAAQVRNRVIVGVGAALLIITMLALFAFNQSVIATEQAATATFAQGQAVLEANNAATQAAIAEIARATSDANALIALDNAATATIAQGEALIQANIAATEAAAAQIARATSDANALIALDNAATATIAQGEALIQANIAATQAAAAQIARATSDANALIALDNAATATIAQGQAVLEANNAATQAAIAEIARATSDYNAEVALDNAATATIAQGEALIQANIAATEAAAAEIARATSDYNAEVALNNAATATIAQGEALIQRDAAELNAAAAFAAQETAIYQANRAATQEALANFNAATAVAAQETVVAIQATAVAAANLERDFQATAAAAEAARARGLALSDGSEEVYNNGNPDLALIMALEASAADPTLAESYRALLEVAYAPGTRLIYGLADGQQHAGPVTSLAYSPDGQYVLSGSKDGTVKLWNAAAGTLARQFGASGDRHTFGVNTVAFSPDGTLAVSGDESGNMLLWDVATGEAVLRFGASSGYEKIGPIRGLVFLPNAANRVVSTNGLNLIAWDTRTGQIAARNNISAEALVGGSLAVSGNGAYLLLGSTIWGGSNISQRQRSFEDGWIGAFGLTSDTALVSLSPDSNEFVLREIVSQIDRVRFRGHSGNITALIFSPDGRYALSGAGSGSTPRPDFSLILWDAATGEPLRRYNGHSGPVNALAFSPDGRYIVSGSDDGQIRSWETTPTGELARYNAAYAVREMAFHPGGSLVALGYDDQSIALVDMNSGQELKRLYGQPNDFTDLFFSPDGGTLVSADISGTIIVWDTPGGSERRRFSAGDTAAFIALSPDASVVYAGTGDGVVRAWNRDTGEVLARFTGSGGITAVALSPDGAVLASAHDNPLGDTIILWDTASGAEIRRFQAGNVRKMAFQPGGGGILVNAGNTLQLFSAATGEGRLFGSGGGAHASPILDLAFSPDGSAALSASVDDIRLWDVNSGRQVFGYRRGASALAYAPDGTTFAASYGTPFAPQSPENTLSLYRVGTRQQVAAWIAANRYLRELSCDEREQYNIPPLCDEAARALTPTPTPETGIVIAGQPINIRARPAETAQAITSVRPGTELVILARAAGWVNVRLDDGREGWMLEQFIQNQ